MTAPLEPIRDPRIEPPPPARRIDRARRDKERGRQGQDQDAPEKHDDDAEADDDTGLHVDVLA